MQARDLMVDPPTISKSEKISHALQIMDKKSTRRLLVMNNGEIVGILTMRSLAKELGSKKRTKPPSSLPVVTAVNDAYTFVDPIDDFNDVVKIMKEKGGVVLVSRNEEDVMGWITPSRILRNYEFEGIASDYMIENPITVRPTERVIHARYLMIENNIGRLPVIENGKVVGIVSEKDVAIAFKEFNDTVPDRHQEARVKEMLVSDIMTRNPITAKADTPLSEIQKIILEKNIGIIPLVDDEEKIVGIITRRRLVRSIPTN
ncbi:MAG: CBS domain-containing protein [Methanosarcinaceae archaeon]|nr:CBS domain-containing protein [Methanosarcinaceae archaeon]